MIGYGWPQLSLSDTSLSEEQFELGLQDDDVTKTQGVFLGVILIYT